MTNVLKIKVGEIYKDGISHDVFQTAWERTSKKGVKYFEVRTPIFVQEVATKPKEPVL